MDYDEEQIKNLLIQYSIFLIDQKVIDNKGFPFRFFAEQYLKRVWRKYENTQKDNSEEESLCRHEDCEPMMATWCFGCQKFIG